MPIAAMPADANCLICADASKEHRPAITKQMREIYTAPTEATAERLFAHFAPEWRDTSQAMIKSWETAWPECIPFLEFPPELRHIVHTTNAIESLNGPVPAGDPPPRPPPERDRSPQSAVPRRDQTTAKS